MTHLENGALKHTAQAYLCATENPDNAPGACGSACGAGDEKTEPASACGSACGAGEK